MLGDLQGPEVDPVPLKAAAKEFNLSYHNMDIYKIMRFQDYGNWIIVT